ncbi:MAG: tRNA (N6-threonylcarbamoyladenosine(37)-N6)-methyltransferase TrmO [Proteobacteria bacterium]|nr:tRNA (N6-threonylcarbamoyladenosine(37)-N6)-methyltransferase TrmO [Pseudomonadota bacterium]MBU1449965.1 tRNA (N6-threonylcarbamoyladenosine(37)-N6)-methyltransferase TrmO [Pseudomonadota bacterium]MBU2469870.1 tRNA (N6-threonylcarbamoyladenosine(37)-N6)-methyltransferase TrmO [Pseudomonadota bacterium]MBU2516168.1 tRNA (N6-threonylcarbamoyladenosine(37)-N6)-methyltransferase TrmO [Pseudomonadota bacterium]
MSEICYEPIGLLHTPFSEPSGAPIQPCGAGDARGRAELRPELVPALEDLAGFSHVILLYHCHRAAAFKLKVRPFLDHNEHGLFATRAPARPNAIGLSVVKLEAVEGNLLHLKGVDMLDQSPLLDVKPYVPQFDAPPGPLRTGWLADKAREASTQKADERFSPEIS